eukprot:snap_masked-scaffold_67-processed-gene-0.60-mRNA-1 protein AED:1.00 eAED:1.00 QI:0/0/0/0/1/1/2/0/65
MKDEFVISPTIVTGTAPRTSDVRRTAPKSKGKGKFTSLCLDHLCETIASINLNRVIRAQKEKDSD